jgi:hypothetical protein
MNNDGKYSPGPVNGKPRPGSARKLSRDAHAEMTALAVDEVLADDYSEQPNDASHRGLDKPVLQAYDPAFIDARSRGRIAIVFIVFFCATVILGATFLTVDSLLGKNSSSLIDYLKYTINLMETIVLLAVGYFFGSRRASNKVKR